MRAHDLRRRHRIGLSVLMLWTLGLTLAACGPGPAQRDADPFAATVVRIGDAVAAEVNGTPIYVSDVRRAGIDMQVIAPSDPLDPDGEQFSYILDWLIQRRLLALESRRRTLDDTQEARRRMAVAREAILYDILVETVEDAAVTEEALRKFYQERLQFPPGEEVRARLIVTETRTEADAVAELARAPGADFSQLALERSIHDATRLEGGDLGYFGRGELPVEEIETVAFATAAGEVSDPFRSRFGWHVIRVEGRRQREHKSFEELRPELAQWLRNEARAQLLEALTEPGRAEVLRFFGPADGATGLLGDGVGAGESGDASAPPPDADRVGLRATRTGLEGE